MKKLLSTVAATTVFFAAACGSEEPEPAPPAQDGENAVDLNSAPAKTQWDSVSGIQAPVDSADGPESTEPVPHQYAHTPQGAVQAAILGQVWMATADDQTWPDVSSTMTAPGAGRDQWAQGRSLMSVNGTIDNAPEFKGFHISDYDENNAQVVLATEYPDVGLTAYPVQLTWQGDWKLVLPTLDTAPDLEEIDSLEGFVEFSA